MDIELRLISVYLCVAHLFQLDLGVLCIDLGRPQLLDLQLLLVEFHRRGADGTKTGIAILEVEVEAVKCAAPQVCTVLGDGDISAKVPDHEDIFIRVLDREIIGGRDFDVVGDAQGIVTVSYGNEVEVLGAPLYFIGFLKIGINVQLSVTGADVVLYDVLKLVDELADTTVFVSFEFQHGPYLYPVLIPGGDF